MIKPSTIGKKIAFALFAFTLMFVPSGTVFAQATPTCTPPEQTQNGVRWPTGSDAGTFTYQCDGPYAGKWTNAYYLYDPATNSRSALYSPDYTYDCTAQQWYKTVWNYSAAKNAYLKATVTTTDPGGIATNCPVPETPVQAPTKTSSTSGTNSPAPQTPQASGNNQSTSNDASGVAAGSGNNVNLNTGTTATMNNGVISFAKSGNATVASNTSAGSATTGDAQVVANVINMLQSSSNVLGDPNVLTFTANINGDVNGDLLLDPSKLSSVQPANTSASLNNAVTVNNSVAAAINNNVDLGANSGNATVASNTSAGNATSGNANAVANIVNVLNSAVTAGQSFIGTININGSLNGDILLPPNFVDTLLASNVPRYTVSSADISNAVNVHNTANQAINNTVTASAASGNASVTNNTSAGSATTGAARTNLTVFNLTGSTVVASNDLLVFVNVLGTWYGLIMNAPAGTTAASLGGGVTSNAAIANTATVNNTANQAINNTVNVASQSGNAAVSDNTKAGNATSGDATASVNLMNMINNSISLNGWFGLLFINVFGTWNGSFGINTAAGNPPLNIPAPSTASSITTPAPVFRFVPSGTSHASGNTSPSTASTPPVAQAVLAAATHIPHPAVSNATGIPALDTVHRNLTIYFIGAGLALAILVIGERNRFFRHQ